MLARLQLLSFLFMLSMISVAQDHKPVNVDPGRLRTLIEQLANKDFVIREKATRELSELDEVPVLLNEATKSSNPEVRKRAQAAMDNIILRAEEKAIKPYVRWIVTADFVANDPHDPRCWRQGDRRHGSRPATRIPM